MKGGRSKCDTRKADSRLAVKRGAEKATKKPVGPNDPSKPNSKPKRPASALFVFMEEFRKKFKEKHPNNKSIVVVGKAGGDKWKSLSDADFLACVFGYLRSCTTEKRPALMLCDAPKCDAVSWNTVMNARKICDHQWLWWQHHGMPIFCEIVSGVVSNVASALFKWLWSLKATTKTEISSRSLMKFEGGYTVETVFDGSKLGIEPFSVEVSPSGELLVLDSENSNLYKISTPLSPYSRPKLVAGSSEGYSGHVDGRPREARMNHPKGLTVDDRGNIYIADTLNMAIRKISEAGVVTIAGGKWGRGGGHVDGPSEDAKFSDDFDLVYIGSSCSLLVIDRGNQAIREIQLHDDDCAIHSDGNLHLGIAVLVAAGFFGYMLALLQRRVRAMFSSPNDSARNAKRKGIPPPPYQRPLKSVRPPLIPNEDEAEKPEEGLFGSIGRLVSNTGLSVFEVVGGLFTGSSKKALNHQFQQQQYYQQPNRHPNAWPVQESFVIPDEDEPPSLETRTPTKRKNYPFMTKDLEQTNQFKQNRSFHGGWNDDFSPQQHQNQHQHQQHHQRHYSSGAQTCYEPSCETNEIVFGAVQEQDGRREAVVIKAVDYGDPSYNYNHNIRSRYNYMGYSSGY